MNTTDCIDYALGEMHGERREAFEQALADSTELQQELKETIALFGTLQRVSKSTEGFDSARRERLLAACQKNIAARKQRSNIIRFAIPLSLAAIILITLTIGFLSPGTHPPSELVAVPVPAATATPDAVPLDSRAIVGQRIAKESSSVTAWPAAASSSPQDEPNETTAIYTTGGKLEIQSAEGGCDFVALEGSTSVPPLVQRTPKHTRSTEDNPFIPTSKAAETIMPLSTTTDSYAAIRKSIRSGILPAPSTIRTDELVNAFSYSFDRATIRGPFAIDIEAGKAPWNPARVLVKVGIQVRNPSDYSSILLKSLMVSLKFDSNLVAGYRLIGYEKNGQPANIVKSLSRPGIPLTLTAIYELEPAPGLTNAAAQTPLFNLVIHYKFPNDSDCIHASVQYPVGSIPAEGQNSTDFRFATAVAALGLKLSQNVEAESMPWPAILQLAANNLGPDTDGQRADFVDLIQRASRLPIS